MPKRKSDTPAAISTPEQANRVPGRPFQPGQSGNPSGRSKAVREVVDIARKHTVTAVNALARIAKDPEQDPRARVAAATVILDRGYGKAPEKVDVSLTTVPTEELERQVLEQLEREGKVKVLKP